MAYKALRHSSYRVPSHLKTKPQLLLKTGQADAEAEAPFLSLLSPVGVEIILHKANLLVTSVATKEPCLKISLRDVQEQKEGTLQIGQTFNVHLKDGLNILNPELSVLSGYLLEAYLDTKATVVYSFIYEVR